MWTSSTNEQSLYIPSLPWGGGKLNQTSLRRARCWPRKLLSATVMSRSTFTSSRMLPTISGLESQLKALWMVLISRTWNKFPGCWCCVQKVQSHRNGWHLIEKKAYAVIASLDHLHWTFMTTSRFDLSMDHKNIYIYFRSLYIFPNLLQVPIPKKTCYAASLSI